MAQAVLDKSSEKFSPYPAEIDNYFINNTVVLKMYPKGLETVAEAEFPDIQMTSAQQYFTYLTQEIDFWSANDSQNIAQKFSQKNSLVNAKAHFDNAVKTPANAKTYLVQSLSALANGCLYSKTKLALILILYLDKKASSNFIEGFWACLTKSTNTSINTVSGLDGYFAGKSYLNVLQEYTQCSVMHIAEFKDNVISASINYSDLNKRFTRAFHHHEDRVKQFSQQVDDCITDMHTKQDTYFSDADTRLKNLEELYEEKLKLQAPAEYWKELKESYRNKGILWLLISVLIAGVTIAFLIFTLFKGENFLTEKADWIDNVKSSAILTVITSIAIYVLRLTSKMFLSSFHLSRDANERESLSYFYLSLIEKKAVTEKERAIVLNALFSRSDTGLLKGEAAPAMSSNVSDLVDIFKTTHS